MRRILCAIAVVLLPSTSFGQDLQAITDDVVQGHILPRFDNLKETSDTLAAAAADDCSPMVEQLRTAYADAFDAWIAASHLRFGPTEVDDRAFALAFWPDSRGVTPKTLAALIADEDPIGAAPAKYADVSVAARGFYALEFLLYDEAFSPSAVSDYGCKLIQTVTADIAATTTAIDQDWQQDYATTLTNPSADAHYRTDQEAAQELFKALSTGLEFTADTRLGRPLGTFDRPRPTRAEVWRSGRSQHHVEVSLASLKDLAMRLTGDNAGLQERLVAAFGRAEAQLATLDDPAFAGVADPQGRFKVEALQTSLSGIRTIIRDELGPQLGVEAGFNALDGD